MDDYGPIESLPQEPVTLFVCATTGQGDQPDNMVKFWRYLLKRSLPKDVLKGLSYGVLGLGDSGYAQFNYAAKRLNRRLAQLGGTTLLPAGLADDQHDLGQDFVIDPWLSSVWQKLLEMFPLPIGLEPISSDVLPPSKYKVIKNSAYENGVLNDEKSGYGPNNPYHSKLLSNQRQTSQGHFQDTRLIELEIDKALEYRPGDVCLVQPQNSEANVEKFLTLMSHLSPDEPFEIVANDENIELPPKSVLESRKTATLRQCAAQVLDFQAVPGRYFFELLSKFTTDELEKEKFVEFTTAEGQQDLYEYCNKPRRTSLEVLNDFSIHTVPNIPLEYLFDLFPTIKPRYKYFYLKKLKKKKRNRETLFTNSS